MGVHRVRRRARWALIAAPLVVAAALGTPTAAAATAPATPATAARVTAAGAVTVQAPGWSFLVQPVAGATAATWRYQYAPQPPTGSVPGHDYTAYCAAADGTGEVVAASSSSGIYGGSSSQNAYTSPSPSSSSGCQTGKGAWRFTVRANNVTVLEWRASGVAASSSSTCATGQGFGAIAASYRFGTLRVYIKWVGTSRPTGGWWVHTPDPGSSATATIAATIKPVPAADAATGWYGVVVTGAPDVNPKTLRVVRSDDTTCFVSASVAVDADAAPPPAETGEDDDGGSCGLNPFCYFVSALKALFVPGDATSTAWNGLWSTASDKPPLSLMLDGVDLVKGVTDGWHTTPGLVHGEFDGDVPTSVIGGKPGSGVPGLDPLGATSLCARGSGDAPDCTTGNTLIPGQRTFRYLIEFILWFFFLWRCWGRVRAASRGSA